MKTITQKIACAFLQSILLHSGSKLTFVVLDQFAFKLNGIILLCLVYFTIRIYFENHTVAYVSNLLLLLLSVSLLCRRSTFSFFHFPTDAPSGRFQPGQYEVGTYRTLYGHTFSFLLGKCLKVEKQGWGLWEEGSRGRGYANTCSCALLRREADSHGKAIICQF